MKMRDATTSTGDRTVTKQCRERNGDAVTFGRNLEAHWRCGRMRSRERSTSAAPARQHPWCAKRRVPTTQRLVATKKILTDQRVGAAIVGAQIQLNELTQQASHFARIGLGIVVQFFNDRQKSLNVGHGAHDSRKSMERAKGGADNLKNCALFENP